MPPKHKSSGAVPSPPKSSQNTTKELTRLEQQDIKAPTKKNSSAQPAKSTSVKSPAASSGNGSGINATYQKPQVPKN